MDRRQINRLKLSLSSLGKDGMMLFVKSVDPQLLARPSGRNDRSISQGIFRMSRAVHVPRHHWPLSRRDRMQVKLLVRCAREPGI